MIIINLLSLFGFIFFTSRCFSFLRNTTPLFSLCSIIFLLFIFGTMNVLAGGVELLVACGLIAFAFCMVKMAINKDYAFKLSFGGWFFIAASLLWLIFSRNTFIFGWDEFFWGQFIKVLKLSDAFYGPNDAVLQSHVRYPPGSALLQYFFMAFSQYKESTLYFANGLIVLASCSLVIDLLEQKKILKVALAITATLLIIINFYGVSYISIIADPIIGILFGSGLCMVVFCHVRFNLLAIILLPIVIALPLIKETGILFSGVIFASYVMKLLFEYKRIRNRRYQLLNVMLWPMLLLVCPLLVRSLWNHHLLAMGLSVPYSMFNWQTFYQLFFNPITLQEKVIPLHFYAAFFKKGILLETLILGLIFLISAFVTDKNKIDVFKMKASIMGVIVIGLLLYLLVLLFVYVYVFTADEGMVLASYERYVGSYIMGMALLSCCALFQITYDVRYEKFIYVAASLIVLCMIILSKSFIFSVFDPLGYAKKHSDSIVVRNEIKPLLKIINQYTLPQDNIWFIYQGSTGLAQMVFRYEIVPRRMNNWNWSLGNPYNKSDIWTKPWSKEMFSHALLTNQYFNYSYLFLAHVDDNFWRAYGDMFSGNREQIKQYRLFKIEKNAQGQAIFNPVITAE